MSQTVGFDVRCVPKIVYTKPGALSPVRYDEHDEEDKVSCSGGEECRNLLHLSSLI